jgi:hypothetical protein
VAQGLIARDVSHGRSETHGQTRKSSLARQVMTIVQEYRDRYCAFADILGFRELISHLRHSPASFDALHSLLKRIHGTRSGEAVDVNDTDFRAQSISDAVAISTVVSAAGLDQLFTALQALSLDLLSEGYFVRGAVVKAPLYHDDQTVFGEALVRAYRFESEVAKYPRIVVTQEVREDMLAYIARGRGKYPKMEILRQSVDGPMYLDVLQPLISLLRKAESPFVELPGSEKVRHSRYMQIRDKIQQRYGEAMDDPRHFEKVRWFARYWNDVIPKNLFLSISAAEREF